MIQKITDLLSFGGLPLLFLLVFLEGNPLVGSFIPGQVIVILVGFLISTLDIFSFWSTFFVVFLGGFLGDLFGFWIGLKYGVSGVSKFGFDSNSQIFKSSKSFFKKFGFFSVILGREFNLTRAFMPFLAGLCRMQVFKFVVVAFFSNLFWTALSLYLGYYFGTIVLQRLEFVFQFITFVLVYVVIVYFIYRSFKKFYHENFTLIRRYAIYNLFYVVFIFLFLVGLLFIDLYGFREFFNGYFSFLYSGFFGTYFGFLSSFRSILVLGILTFFFLIFYPLKHRFRFLVLFIWGVLLAVILTVIFARLLFLYFGIKLYISLIFVTILSLFFSLLAREIFTSRRVRIRIEFGLVAFIFLFILSKAALSENFFLVVVSFMVAVLECEIMIILSHYKLLDKYLAESMRD